MIREQDLKVGGLYEGRATVRKKLTVVRRRIDDLGPALPNQQTRLAWLGASDGYWRTGHSTVATFRAWAERVVGADDVAVSHVEVGQVYEGVVISRGEPVLGYRRVTSVEVGTVGRIIRWRCESAPDWLTKKQGGLDENNFLKWARRLVPPEELAK